MWKMDKARRAVEFTTVLGLILAGCAHVPQVQYMRMPEIVSVTKKSEADYPAATGQLSVTNRIEYQPHWLYVTTDPEHNTGCRIEVKASAVTLAGFSLLSYEPKRDPLTVSYIKGKRIAYHKGKGEITNEETGETVVVPLKEIRFEIDESNQLISR